MVFYLEKPQEIFFIYKTRTVMDILWKKMVKLSYLDIETGYKHVLEKCDITSILPVVTRRTPKGLVLIHTSVHLKMLTL